MTTILPRNVLDGYSLELGVNILDNLVYDALQDPTNPEFINLQKAYENSIASDGYGKIKLQTGGDFRIIDDTDDSIYFNIDAETGKVTILGDLDVLGESTVVESTITDSDHWLISPGDASQVALKIEPNSGVNYLTDLVQIFDGYESGGGDKVFRVETTVVSLLVASLQVAYIKR